MYFQFRTDKISRWTKYCIVHIDMNNYMEYSALFLLVGVTHIAKFLGGHRMTHSDGGGTCLDSRKTLPRALSIQRRPSQLHHCHLWFLHTASPPWYWESSWENSSSEPKYELFYTDRIRGSLKQHCSLNGSRMILCLTSASYSPGLFCFCLFVCFFLRFKERVFTGT